MSPSQVLPRSAARRIVVLDSNPILVSVTGVLRMAGYCVFQAHDGQAASELCATLEHISLLVLNTHVDGTDGTQLMREIHERLPDMPILHVDTHRDPTVPGGISTLTEPFTSAALLSAVRELMPGGKTRE